MKNSVLWLFAVAVLSASISLVIRTGEVGAQPTTLADSAPIGSIVAWPGQFNTIPAGWMECDGRELSNVDNGPNGYKALFEKIGTTWGGVGTTKFKIPNLQGQFLRGADHGSGIDPDVGIRQPAGTATKSEPGSFQGFALQDHTHNIGGHHLEAQAGKQFEGSGFKTNSDENAAWNGPFETSKVLKGPAKSDNETRPKNASICWIIRAK
jgi:microcystin-dependent protein